MCDTRAAAQTNDSSRNSFAERERERRCSNGDKCVMILQYIIMLQKWFVRLRWTVHAFTYHFCLFLYTCIVLDNYTWYDIVQHFSQKIRYSFSVCADSGCQSSQNSPWHRYIDLLTFLQRILLLFALKCCRCTFERVELTHFLLFHIYWTYQISLWHLCTANIVLLFMGTIVKYAAYIVVWNSIVYDRTLCL